MHPYSCSIMDEDQKIYNYCHSRVRRVIENEFGILSSRWQIFKKPVSATVSNVKKYTLACFALHNYLRLTDNAYYCSAGFVDSENRDGSIKLGGWHNHEYTGSTTHLRPVRESRYSNDVFSMRKSLKRYITSQ